MVKNISVFRLKNMVRTENLFVFNMGKWEPKHAFNSTITRHNMYI